MHDHLRSLVGKEKMEQLSTMVESGFCYPPSVFCHARKYTHDLATVVLAVTFFFLMTRPPPSSTLFPYTTLFRSRPPGSHRWTPRRAVDRSPPLRRSGRVSPRWVRAGRPPPRTATRFETSPRRTRSSR